VSSSPRGAFKEQPKPKTFNAKDAKEEKKERKEKQDPTNLK
jgi:hypothetical protein